METTATSVRDACIEQVMRTTGDEIAVLALLDLDPADRHRTLVVVGRLMGDAPVSLAYGCPLHALATGTDIDPSWRDRCPAAPGSLWGTLEMLRTLYGDQPGGSCYDEYARLRDFADDDIADH